MSATPSTLLRRPEPPAARAAPPEPAVVVTGTLLEDAYTSTEPATGRAAFTVTIAQKAGNPAIVATRWVGDGPDAAIYASRRASNLRAGDVVTVHGDGLRMRYSHGTLLIALAFVRDVELQASRQERRA